MASLETLERAFKAAVTGDDPAFLDHVAEAGPLDAGDRVAIYANAYQSRLRDALATDYDRLAALVGEDVFAEMARAYVAAHPSTHPSLRTLGQHLPDFLEQTRPWSEEPTFAELARFEWALVDAFDAADAEPVALAAVAALPADAWPGLRLAFHPSLQTVDVTYPTPALWHALRDQDKVRKPDPLDHPARVVVWRQGLKTRFRTMDVDEAVGLEAMAARGTFADLCEQLTEWRGDGAPARAASLLKTWIEDGQVTALAR